MKAAFLIAGALVQIALGALHAGMFFVPIPDGARPAGYVLNACVTSILLFFACVSLFMRAELTETPMGRVVCWFIALFYLQSVVTGMVRSGGFLGSPLSGLLLATALLYALAAVSTWRRQLLTAAAILQATLAARHAVAFFQPATPADLPERLGRSFSGFNAAATIVVVFFAYLSFFKQRELVETRLGRILCWFIALVYLQRVILDVLVPGFDEPRLIGALGATVLLYLTVAASPRLPRAAEGSLAPAS